MKALLLITIGYALTWIFLLFPENRFIKPYVFSNQEISVQAYVDYLTTRIFYFMLILSVREYVSEEYVHAVNIVSVFFLFYIIDYLVIYNYPIGYLKGWSYVHEKPTGLFIPISYSLFMGVNLVLICLYYSVKQWIM